MSDDSDENDTTETHRELRRQLRSSSVNLFATLAPSALSVVFQPIVDLRTRAVFAQEALVRCNIPELKNPLTLFEKAVEGHFSGLLGRMIRELAVPACSGLPLFLNVHPNELVERWLVRPDDPLHSHDNDIYLEITETVSFSHFRLCMDVLRELRHRGGVHLVVDDLGSGYSNLKRLSDLEPKIVKVDRELVRDIDHSRRQQLLLRGVVRLCEDLGARVVAEGIERKEELKAVIDTGAHYAQGFVLARPAYPAPKAVWPA